MLYVLIATVLKAQNRRSNIDIILIYARQADSSLNCTYLFSGSERLVLFVSASGSVESLGAGVVLPYSFGLVYPYSCSCSLLLSVGFNHQ